MTVHSASMVRVARGISSILLIFVLSFYSFAQTTADDPFQKQVTIIGHNMHFEDVLEQLTLQTKVQFIYSSSMVSLDKPVSLIARQQSLKNVLDELCTQMNVSFKRQGEYFIVKRNIAPSLTTSQFTSAKPKLANSEELEDEPLTEPQPSRYTSLDREPEATVTQEAIAKDLLNFDGLDPKEKMKYKPQMFSYNLQRAQPKNWFASAGVLINDYSVGLEVQGGIRLLHAIVNASALGDGLYRIGYGVGTGIPLKPGVTANLAYTFASVKRDGLDTWQNEFQSRAKHHQIRLMANILISDHFSIRVGPTFNLLRTSFEFIPEQPGQSASMRYRPAPSQQYLSPSSNYPYTYTVHYQAPKPPDDYATSRSWIGFEVGVAYRVNFSLRK